MEEINDYLTVTKTSEGLYKEKGSKFIGIATHVESLEDIKTQLEEIKKVYYDARHHCYAYRIDPINEQFRSNDDGEPSGTAGKPILNQLLSYEVTNTLVIVVRYFGGTKLGVSGLIRAYKSAAQDALDNNKIVKRFITKDILLNFEYPLMNSVMRIVKDENLKIVKQNYQEKCEVIIRLKKNQEKVATEKFNLIYELKLTYL